MLTETAARTRVDYIPLTSPAPRTIRVALAGCGVVGGSFARLLQESTATLAARHGVRVEIATVLVRDITRDRNVNIAPSIFTDDLETFLSVPVDVVVEAIGGLDPARVIAEKTLTRRNRLITANKQLVAEHGARLERIARAGAAQFDFDASVGGGAPVIRTLRDSIATVRPLSLRGILNGTSNFVLSELEKGETFESAIASARSRGLAEEDYSRDLDGRDSAAKIAILAWRAFNVDPATVAVRRVGLLPDPGRFVRHAARLRARARLLAECALVGESVISANVYPAVVPGDGAFGRTVGEENRVDLDLGWSTPLSVTAPGAGGIPTATALLSDLLFTPGAQRVADRKEFAVIDDPRPHRWLVATRGPREIAQTLLQDSDVFSIERDHATNEIATITEPLTCAAIDTITGNLLASGADPIVARLEIPILSGNLQ